MSPLVPISYRARLAPFLLAAFLAWAVAAAAQAPFTLLHSLFDPGTNGQAGTQPGWSVAADGDLGVVGSPLDEAGGAGTGAVKVYELSTGTLLHTLTHPNPIGRPYFSTALAISGTRIVVGATGDDTGAVDAGTVYVYDVSSATPTVPLLTLTNPSPAAYDSFGSSVGISHTWVVVGAYKDDTGATDAGCAYVYNLAGATPGVPVLTLTNPSPAVVHCFGRSVAISGSGAVVGAYHDDTGAGGTANTCVYDLAGPVPALPVYTLTNPSPPLCGYTGYAVAISGSRVVVGLNPANFWLFTPGSACVYDLASVLPEIPILTLTNPGPASSPFFGDSFGYAVAISGTRIVVGAYYDHPIVPNAGSAFVFDLTSPSPTEPVATLTNPSAVTDDWFGWAVAISGAQVLVGAPLDDAGATDAGSAYVYDLDGALPGVPTAGLTNPTPEPFDLFGSAVAISGTRVVAGAHQNDTGAVSAGKAYIYDLAGATPRTPVITLTNPSPAAYDYFGRSVAIDGTRVVIGAAFDDSGATDAGSVFIYELSSATPSVPALTLTKPGAAANDYFGHSVGIASTRVVIGAYGDDIGATDAGSAYVFDLASATPALPMLTLTNPSPLNRGLFGKAVAISDALVVVGAELEDNLAFLAGSAYVYDLASLMPSIPIAKLTRLNPEPVDFFGYSVAISGRRVVVGAHQANAGVNNAGSAYVYDLAGAAPGFPSLTLTNPIPSAYDQFGWSVAISGTRVIIGVPHDELEAGGTGVAYVYELAGGAPDVPVAVLDSPTPGIGAQLGYSVALDGGTVACGAPYQDSAGRGGGAAYVFGVGPSLRIAPAAPGFANILWAPATSSGFVLQYTDSLAPAHWVDAPSGAANPVTVPATNASRFYRLFQP